MQSVASARKTILYQQAAYLIKNAHNGWSKQDKDSGKKSSNR